MNDHIFIYWDELPLDKPTGNEQDTNLLHRQDSRNRGKGCGDGLPTWQLQFRYGTHLPDASRKEAKQPNHPRHSQGYRTPWVWIRTSSPQPSRWAIRSKHNKWRNQCQVCSIILTLPNAGRLTLSLRSALPCSQTAIARMLLANRRNTKSKSYWRKLLSWIINLLFSAGTNRPTNILHGNCWQGAEPKCILCI